VIQIHKNKKQGSILISQMNHFGNELESSTQSFQIRIPEESTRVYFDNTKLKKRDKKMRIQEKKGEGTHSTHIFKGKATVCYIYSFAHI